MAKYWKAQQRPIKTNYAVGGNTPRLYIVHIMQGTLAGTDSWFHNPESNVSAHFGIGADGTVYQWVDTANQAWHAMGANDHSIGVENEGMTGHQLTPAQVEANAQLLAWVHKTYSKVDLWLNTHPQAGSGLSYHALGGDAWGGHLLCPGQSIVKHLPRIL